jgi:hypothetical protein
MNPANTPHMTELRSHLMETLASLRDRENPMEPDRARAVAQVAGVLVDTARVEVDYIKATGADHSNFLQAETGALPQLGNGPSAHNPFPVSVRNRIAG